MRSYQIGTEPIPTGSFECDRQKARPVTLLCLNWTPLPGHCHWSLSQLHMSSIPWGSDVSEQEVKVEQPAETASCSTFQNKRTLNIIHKRTQLI